MQVRIEFSTDFPKRRGPTATAFRPREQVGRNEKQMNSSSFDGEAAIVFSSGDFR